MKNVVNCQKSSSEMWVDEKGRKVWYNRTTKTERLKERRARELRNKALRVNEQLASFKSDIQTICQEVFDTYMAENKLDISKHKGNFTWFNFDRSIKVEVSISERVEFDSLALTGAKELLDEFLEENVESKDDFVKELIMDAFETSRGSLDVKKIFDLIRYKSKIKNKKYQQAVKMLEDGIRRPDSKTYFRISQLMEDGSYEVIDLNLSSIRLP
ncbi:MAG: DUF3164 family protein [Putridiphycobacter sp.]|nr:DUF3164 family protein [Putridiphycobacter sp.]